MSDYQRKISYLFGFPPFSFPVSVAVLPVPAAKVATSSIGWREPLRAEHASAFISLLK